MTTGSAVLAWVQAPHWVKKEKKISASEKNETSERNEPRGSLGRGFARRYFSYLTPFFAFFPHFGDWSQATAALPLLCFLPFYFHIRASSPIPADPTISEPGTGYFRQCLQWHGILPTNSRTLFAPFLPSKENMFSGHRHSL